VSVCGGKHNHKRGPRVYKHYPESRRIKSDSLLANVDEMRKRGTKAKGILFYLREISGKTPTLKDVHNILARLKNLSRSGATDVQRAEAFLRDTSKIRRLFSAFPEVMMEDTTFGTNRNRYKLFSFLVHGINGKGQYVQHSMLAAETRANMTDAVKTFKKNNEKWRSIKVIVTNKDFTERAVLSEAFPSARMLLCQYHVVTYLDQQ
ncbi:hypothetical protein JG687_00014156, partial [Phytophthora cactorum]